jgi:hypothetical protein
MRQPFVKTGLGFASDFLPSGAPWSAQATSVLMSASASDQSLANLPPTWGSANHGGMRLDNTASRIAFA